MNEIMQEICTRIETAPVEMGLLNTIFGAHREEALAGRPIVVYGAGGMGFQVNRALNRRGISPVCFCDGDASKAGSRYSGLPVVSLDELKSSHRNSLIILATAKYVEEVTNILLEQGFDRDLLLCKKSDLGEMLPFLHKFFIPVTQDYLWDIEGRCHPLSLFDVLKQNEQNILDAYHSFADDKSRNLFIAKLALYGLPDNLKLLRDFLLHFSEPILQLGVDRADIPTEDYYYFNNDVIRLKEGEVYVDVGAADGDTVSTFVQACKGQGIDYAHIYALEPDPQCYRDMLVNTSGVGNISCHELGLWSEKKSFRFVSSAMASHKEAGGINGEGDIEIQAVALDDFMEGGKVTLIKMDPPGNIIPDVLRGAVATLTTHRPKLALGVYHSVKAIFEIPLLVKSICPDYKLYLRHNTPHLCDTDLYAVFE